MIRALVFLLIESIKNGGITVELKNQINFLKKQLEKAEDRETKANARIDTLLTLIEMKPPQTNMTRFTDQHTASDIATDSLPEPKNDELTIPTQKEDKRIPVPEHAEPEPEPVKRGFWKRFFLPNG